MFLIYERNMYNNIKIAYFFPLSAIFIVKNKLIFILIRRFIWKVH